MALKQLPGKTMIIVRKNDKHIGTVYYPNIRNESKKYPHNDHGFEVSFYIEDINESFGPDNWTSFEYFKDAVE